MRPIIVVLLAVAASAAAQYEPVFTDYHNQIGIPEAARIKAAEESMDFDGARIAGGAASGLGQFPFFGGLLITLMHGPTSVCGSTVVSNTRAVTAAHCWSHFESRGRILTIVLGSIRLYSGGTRLTTNRVVLHGNYFDIVLANDVAIITFNHVPFSNVINRILLPAGAASYVGVTGVAVGFGRTGDGPAHNINNNQVLRHVSVPIISNDECRRTFGNMLQGSNICTSGAGGRGPCGGDSGGPLWVGGPTLVGIVSFGSRYGCQRGFPTAYARVTSFVAWIRSRM
ncbi:brachyurin-like [Epargyreus clarus]|uniref:brachyurin-like n=1 Tax=Epargyreus clarus TaxID=520877 RepID=UPI003C2D4D23